MMQTAEIETARPVIRIVDDDEVFLASQKFSLKLFSLKSAYGLAQSVISMKRISALRDALFWTTACRTGQAWTFSAHCF